MLPSQDEVPHHGSQPEKRTLFEAASVHSTCVLSPKNNHPEA
jgi:hypothetical protein